MSRRPLKPGAAQRCVDALALLHKPPQLTDEERARIAHELALPREGMQAELPLKETPR